MAKTPSAPPKRDAAEILEAYQTKCKLFLADAGIHGLEETLLAAKCRTKKNGSALFQEALESRSIAARPGFDAEHSLSERKARGRSIGYFRAGICSPDRYHCV